MSPERSEAADPWSRRILWAALCVGLVRFVELGRWSLWLDEVYTLADARHGTGFLNPLGYLIFGWFYDLAERRPDEFLLRLPAALFGWLSIPAAAFAVRPFVSRRAAALTALLVALSPWHLYWSQNARFYTLAGLLCLCVPALLIGGLRGRPWASLRILAALLGAGLGLLTHPSAAMLLAPLFGFAVLGRALWGPIFPPSGGRDALRARNAWRLLVLLSGLSCLGTLLWASVVWRTWSNRRGEGDPLHLVLSAGYLVTPGVGLLLLLSVAGAVRSGDRRVLALAAWLGTAIGVALAASFAVRVSAQYVFVFFPFFAALACAGVGGEVEAVGRGRGPLRTALLALLFLPLVVESGLYFTARHGDRPRWRAAYRYVFDQREPTDLVLGNEAPVGEYYFVPGQDDLRQLRSLVYLNEFHAGVPAAWARYGRPMWLIVNKEQLLDWPADEREGFRSFLRNACREVASFPVAWTPRDLDVSVYHFPAD